MRGDSGYMNLNRAERLVLEEFQRQGRGQIWLTRRTLEQCLYDDNPPDHPAFPFHKRALDRVIPRLEKWGLIVRFPTRDHGEYYALAETAKAKPYVEPLLRQRKEKGKQSMAFAPPFQGRPVITITINEPKKGPRKVA